MGAAGRVATARAAVPVVHLAETEAVADMRIYLGSIRCCAGRLRPNRPGAEALGRQRTLQREVSE